MPEDERPHRKAYEKGVEEISHLCIFPDEGPLQVGQSDDFKLNVAHQRGNGALTVLKYRRPSPNPRLSGGAGLVLIRHII
jgi:hypothetical protein